MTLELDHVVCMVDDLDLVCAELELGGWALDAGTTHRGEGTRNRRLLWPEQHLELLCVVDVQEARASALGFDRRADWRTTGASPFGLGFRGQLPAGADEEFWLHEEHGTRIWMHRDNERAPQRPLVFIVELAAAEMESRRPRASHRDLLDGCHGRDLLEVRVTSPSPPSLPPALGPPRVVLADGAHRLELVVSAPTRLLQVTPILAIRG